MSKLNKKRTILIGAIAVLIILFATGRWITGKYRRMIKKELPVWVMQATDSLYKISVKRVSINIINRSVTLKNVKIWPDSNRVAQIEHDTLAPAHYLVINIPKLHVSNIMWDELIGGEGFSCGTFSINSPTVRVFPTVPEVRKRDTTQKHSNTVKELSISNIRITNADAKYYNATANKDSSYIHFAKGEVSLDNWKYEPGVTDTSRFLLAENGTITIDTITGTLPKAPYTFQTLNTTFNSNKNRLVTKDLKLFLNISQEEFFRRAKKQKEVYDINFRNVELDGLQWNKLARNKQLIISTIYLNHCDINVFFNRMLPENDESKMGKFPSQLLQKLKLPVYVKNIKLNNGNVIYSELSGRTNKKGTVYFERIDGQVTNVTNIAERIEEKDSCIANLQGKFNKYSDMTATFRFKLGDPKGAFSVDTKLEGLQYHQINEQSKAFTRIDIRSLNVKKMEMQLVGNEDYAKSYFTLIYNNLKIKILKPAPDDTTVKRKGRGFITFIANNMVLYTNNPMPGEKLRTVRTYIYRDAQKSFFNLIWKNIHQGVQETTIRNKSVINIMKQAEQRRKNKRNKRLKEIFGNGKNQD